MDRVEHFASTQVEDCCVVACFCLKHTQSFLVYGFIDSKQFGTKKLLVPIISHALHTHSPRRGYDVKVGSQIVRGKNKNHETTQIRRQAIDISSPTIISEHS